MEKKYEAIMSNLHAHLLTIVKTPAKFQNILIKLLEELRSQSTHMRCWKLIKFTSWK